MKQILSIIGIVLLITGCDGNNTDRLEIGAGEEIQPPRSDGAVNGYTLTRASGFREHLGERSEWVNTSDFWEEENGKYGMAWSTCDIEFHDVCSSTLNYLFDENGRVESETSSGWWGVSRIYFETKEDLVRRRKGTPADLVYTHDQNGNVASLDFGGLDSRGILASFTHNNAGQITHASFTGKDTESHYIHHYNDKGQRIRSEIFGGSLDSFHFAPQYEHLYEYDENGNNTIETIALPSGEIIGKTIFEYAPSDRRIVNLRLRQIIYFDFWIW